MLWWKKVKNWSFHHWRLLVVLGIGLTAFLLGKRNASKYKLQAQIIKKLYEEEKQVIEKAHANKSTKNKQAVETYRKAIAVANRRYMKSRSDIDRRQASRVAELVEQNKDNPDAIDDIFKKQFGFKISETE